MNARQLLARIRTALTPSTARIATLEADIAGDNIRIESLEAQVDELCQCLAHFDEQIVDHESQIAEAEGEIANLIGIVDRCDRATRSYEDLDLTKIESMIESAIDDIDLDTPIENALDDIDWATKIGEIDLSDALDGMTVTLRS